MRKIFLVFLILFFCVSSALAYTLEIKTHNSLEIYKKVHTHRFTEDFLVIYILDSFDNYKIMISKRYIMKIKIIKE